MDNLRKAGLWKRGAMFLVFLIAFALVPLCVQAKETDRKVTIYGLGSSVQDKISIPADLAQSYQIPADSGGKASYRIISGKSAKVSGTGLVAPKYTYWKKYPNYSATVSEGEAYDYYTLESGETSIEVKTANETYTLTVNVEDYTVTYGDEVMDKYLRDNITETMTDREILDAVARFPASYEYSASHSGVYSMIIYGGGDCWASTGAITALCEKMGIKAWARNANKDPGAGSGHMNAMAELNGVYYELEAGYSMDKVDGFRPYSVTVRDSLFSYYISSGSLVIYQYDGYENSGMLEVPAEIGGRTVEKIDKSAFSRTKFSEIKLPSTLTEIGDYAFSDCGELTRITIPASVTKIGRSVFASCGKLVDLSVAEENANYREEGQVIYSKDGSTLVTCPAAGNVVIPPTVTNIADYAFYYNENLQQIVIPSSVVELGEGAFGNCGRLAKVDFEGEGLTRIGMHCFRSNDKLCVIRIPSSVKSVSAFAFAYCYQLKHIYFMGDAPEFGDAVEGTFYDNAFQGCSLHAYYIQHNDTWTQEKLENHGGTVTWQPWAGTDGISIENAVLMLEQSKFAYTGAYITPAVTLGIDGVDLIENKDFTVVYTNNKEVGTATVTVLGIGSYYGEVSATFTITDSSDSVQGGSGTGEDNPENNNQADSRKTKYFDSQTGFTVMLDGIGKQEATLLSVDKKRSGGTLRIPNTMKVKGNSYKITAIGKNAFKNHKQLKKITIGRYVKTIGAGAFQGCTKLQTVTASGNVTVIGDKAFYKCSKLQKITIPVNVNKIGKSAFYGCKSLKSMNIKTKKLTSKNVGSKAFKGIYPKATIKVPRSKFAVYKKILKAKGVGAKVKIKK